jgi:uncharacterized Zn-binding protein involved in type VI secretion
MASFVLHQGATVLCAHGGAAAPVAPDPRVMVSGQPVATIASRYAIEDCPLPLPPTANGPCATGRFITASTRVRVSGAPVLLKDSASVCVPTGTPLRPIATQARVSAI